MHWTLVTLLLLCAACSMLNIEQWVVTGTVRASGLLICSTWSAQQVWWGVTGSDNLFLFIICDAAIVIYLLSNRRVLDWRDRIVAVAIPFTTALGVFAYLNEGHTPESWWVNWWIVAGQMVFGLPAFMPQHADASVSHGALRRAPGGGT